MAVFSEAATSESVETVPLTERGYDRRALIGCATNCVCGYSTCLREPRALPG